MEPRQGKQVPQIYTYLDTIYWTFYLNLEKPRFIQSEYFNLCNFDDERFCLQAVMSSDTTIAIELLRVMMNPSKPRDDGYILEVNIALIGSRTAAENRTMDSKDYVSVDYEIANLKQCENKGSWAVKCVIKMKEGTYLNNNLRNQQENLLRIMESNPSYSTVTKEKIAAMASLLKRKSISKIFTGRQCHNFAINKCIFIERTLRYAEEIDKKFKAKKSNASYVQKHLPLKYLFYIYCEKDGKISLREAADLYVSACYYGLEYLQVECADFLLKDLELCSELFPEVLLVADLVIDKDLLDKLLEIYVNNTVKILGTVQFNSMANCEEFYCQSMIHVLTVKTVEMQQLVLGTLTGERSKPPDSVGSGKSSGRKYSKKRHGKGGKS